MPEFETCSAFTRDKGPCPMRAKQEGMCKSHYNSYLYRGPKNFSLLQLESSYRYQLKEFNNHKGHNCEIELEHDVLAYRLSRELSRFRKSLKYWPDHKTDITYRVKETERVRLRELKSTENSLKEHLKNDLNRLLTAGYTFAEADLIRANLFKEFDVLLDLCEENEEKAYYRMIFKDDLEAVDYIVDRIQEEQNNNNDLREFVNDSQNVHLSSSVEMVVKTYSFVLDMKDIPEDYKWKPNVVSKTVGEVITECSLLPAVCQWMITKYIKAETIYDIEHAYPRILDAVWNFVKNHEDKAMLVKTLAQQLTDNVGMCEQGNISRLCSVLEGYIDGIEVRSRNEQVGELLSNLHSEDTDKDEKIERAKYVLRSLKVPSEEWDSWIEPFKT